MSSSTQEYKPKTYIDLHKDIRFHPHLSFGEKLFFAELSSLAKNSEFAFSSRKMSKYFNVSHQTILNWIKKLIELDLIEVVINYTEPDYLQTQFIRIKKHF